MGMEEKENVELFNKKVIVMNRINQLFDTKKRDILSIYFCAGAPLPDNTVAVVRAL